MAINEEVQQFLQKHPQWKLHESPTPSLVWDGEVKNFLTAVEYIQSIAPLAESANHHPDIALYGYKHLRISLTTHDQGKVTEKDVALAQEIDAVLSQD